MGSHGRSSGGAIAVVPTVSAPIPASAPTVADNPMTKYIVIGVALIAAAIGVGFLFFYKKQQQNKPAASTDGGGGNGPPTTGLTRNEAQAMYQRMEELHSELQSARALLDAQAVDLPLTEGQRGQKGGKERKEKESKEGEEGEEQGRGKEKAKPRTKDEPKKVRSRRKHVRHVTIPDGEDIDEDDANLEVVAPDDQQGDGKEGQDGDEDEDEEQEETDYRRTISTFAAGSAKQKKSQTT